MSDMGTKRITERFAFTGGKVRRDGAYPVVEGVLLCGPTSANRRRYTDAATAGEKVKRYDGRPVFIDHGHPNAPRSYRDKLGTIENARHRADGRPVGDIAVNPKHPAAEQFLWDAEFKPGSCGMSHVAHCETKAGADGWDEVTEVVEVESVDVVIGPATTNGLYEQTGGTTVATTIKQFAEWVAKHPKSTTAQTLRAKRLAEMDGYGDLPAMDAAPEPDGDVDEGISAAFRSAIMSVVEKALDEEMDPKEALAKIKTLLNSHKDATDAGTGKGGGEGEEEPAEEGKRRGGDFITEAEAAGVDHLTLAEIAVLQDIRTAAGRKRFFESIKARKTAAEQPTSGGRTAPGQNGIPEQKKPAAGRTTEQTGWQD